MKTKTHRSTKHVGAKAKGKAPKREKLSGWQYTKRRREKQRAAIAAAGIVPTAEVITRIGRLETAADWHDQLADLYKRARCGDMEKTDASRLAWICSEGAKLSRSIAELRELETLREQLQQLNGGAPLSQLMHADQPHQYEDQPS